MWCVPESKALPTSKRTTRQECLRCSTIATQLPNNSLIWIIRKCCWSHHPMWAWTNKILIKASLEPAGPPLGFTEALDTLDVIPGSVARTTSFEWCQAVQSTQVQVSWPSTSSSQWVHLGSLEALPSLLPLCTVFLHNVSACTRGVPHRHSYHRHSVICSRTDLCEFDERLKYSSLARAPLFARLQ